MPKCRPGPTRMYLEAQFIPLEAVGLGRIEGNKDVTSIGLYLRFQAGSVCRIPTAKSFVTVTFSHIVLVNSNRKKKIAPASQLRTRTWLKLEAELFLVRSRILYTRFKNLFVPKTGFQANIRYVTFLFYSLVKARFTSFSFRPQMGKPILALADEVGRSAREKPLPDYTSPYIILVSIESLDGIHASVVPPQCCSSAPKPKLIIGFSSRMPESYWKTFLNWVTHSNLRQYAI